jgi:tetratricopeptide (TPR) repeat protein
MREDSPHDAHPSRGRRAPAGSDRHHQFSYASAFRNAYERLETAASELSRTRQSARGLSDELLAQPRARRDLLLGNSRRFASWGLVEQLLEQARSQWGSDPERAAELCRLALEVIDQLGAEHGRCLVNDLAARAWSYLATALRDAGDAPAIEEAFQQASHLLHQGTGDPFELAEWLDLYAAHDAENGRIDRAIERLNRMVGLFQRVEDRYLAARALFHQAHLAFEQGHRAAAVSALRRAADWVQRSYWARFRLHIRRAEVVLSSRRGDHAAAWSRLPELRRLTLSDGQPQDLLILRWIDGLVADRLGFRMRALSSLRRACDCFCRDQQPLNASLVLLDLAAFYLRRGETPDLEAASLAVRELLSAAAPPPSVLQEARQAMLRFAFAAQQGTLSLELTESTRRQLLVAMGNLHGGQRQFSIIHAPSEEPIHSLRRAVS